MGAVQRGNEARPDPVHLVRSTVRTFGRERFEKGDGEDEEEG